jgi:hypothetical protein
VGQEICPVLGANGENRIFYVKNLVAPCQVLFAFGLEQNALSLQRAGEFLLTIVTEKIYISGSYRKGMEVA